MTISVLDREEYIEQAYFFRIFRERLEDNIPAQEVLELLPEELLSTTKLTMAVRFLATEAKFKGRISDGMCLLTHYFAPFQCYIMMKAEEDHSKFTQSIALQILELEAKYRSESPTPAGMFIYQFECISRNNLGYDPGMTAIAKDQFFDTDWHEWINKIKRQLGSVDFADMIYYRSEYFVSEKKKRTGRDFQASVPILFNDQEGRIAKANKGRDPLYMFAAFQRQLDYPVVPRLNRRSNESTISRALEIRLQKIEQTLQIVQQEVRGGLDLTQFYVKPDHLDGPPDGPDGGDL